ncbi:LuxR family transcriptional regulator, partial [Streptomyces zhihengii]
MDRALELLARAHRLTGPATEPGTRATVLERLLDTAVSGGRPGAVPTGADGLTGDPGLPPARRAGLHARLAETAALAGRPAEAVRHIDVARLLLGDRPDDAHRAVVDVAAAHVELHRLTPDRLTAAAALARRGADAAERAGLPELAGRALLLLGQLAAEQDEAAAAALVLRACALAHAGGLPALRAAADLRLAGLAAARDGRPGPVDEARDDARRTGVLPPALDASFFLALDQVRRGEFTAAAERLREAAADAERLGLGACLARLRLADAVRYAHQGRRAEMEEALERLGPLVDAAPGVRAMSYGLARAFCSLLEDEHDAAEREFAQALAYDTENPATCDIGRHGIVLLLGVVAGRMGRRHHADVARAGAGGTRWNRQFVALADAVLLGREGRPVEASAAAGAA